MQTVLSGIARSDRRATSRGVNRQRQAKLEFDTVFGLAGGTSATRDALTGQLQKVAPGDLGTTFALNLRNNGIPRSAPRATARGVNRQRRANMDASHARACAALAHPRQGRVPGPALLSPNARLAANQNSVVKGLRPLWGQRRSGS